MKRLIRTRIARARRAIVLGVKRNAGRVRNGHREMRGASASRYCKCIVFPGALRDAIEKLSVLGQRMSCVPKQLIQPRYVSHCEWDKDIRV